MNFETVVLTLLFYYITSLTKQKRLKETEHCNDPDYNQQDCKFILTRPITIMLQPTLKDVNEHSGTSD